MLALVVVRGVVGLRDEGMCRRLSLFSRPAAGGGDSLAFSRHLSCGRELYPQ